MISNQHGDGVKTRAAAHREVHRDGASIHASGTDDEKNDDVEEGMGSSDGDADASSSSSSEEYGPYYCCLQTWPSMYYILAWCSMMVA